MARYEGRCRWVFDPDLREWELLFDPLPVIPAHSKFDLKVPGPYPHGPAGWMSVAFDFVPINPDDERG